jgi:hypothetical protein
VRRAIGLDIRPARFIISTADDDRKDVQRERPSRGDPLPPAAGSGVAHRLVDDPGRVGLVRRAADLRVPPMIRGEIPASEMQPYLHAGAWLTDAARLPNRTPEALAAEPVDTMIRSGAIVHRAERLHAAAEHTPVAG